MRETPQDMARLQQLLDRSYATAGRHLREVITAERRLDAVELAQRLRGMCLLTLATVTADGRPVAGAVDGFFYRGEWYFGSSDDSVRFRHLRSRPKRQRDLPSGRGAERHGAWACPRDRRG